jgi:hypothetical protein
MAQPQKTESQISLVGHAMIGDTLGTPILQCDLLEEIQNLHKEEAWLQGTGPSSKTLVKHPDLRIVLLAMRKKRRRCACMNTERRQGSRCRLSQGTFALGCQIAWWSCPRGRCLYSINVFPTMSKRRKIAPSCLPCRGMVKDISRCVEAHDHKDLRYSTRSWTC